jgi:hypothetical protein
MKSWFRALGLTVVLALAAFEAANASWHSQYGTCYVQCGDKQFAYDFMTHEECCTTPRYCPDGSYASWAYWSPYEGWPLFCPG